MVVLKNMTSPSLTTNTAALVAVFLFACGLPFASVTQAQAPVVDKSIGATPAPVPAPAAAPTTPTSTTTKLAPTPAVATPLVSAPAVIAKSFVTVGDKAVVMFDAPAAKANRTFIINRHTPLEMLVKLDKWVKVRDAENTVGWIEASALGDKRHVQIAVTSADVRTMPNAASMLVFDAQRTVLLEVTSLATADGWLPVKHRDGQVGFVRLMHVWGA